MGDRRRAGGAGYTGVLYFRLDPVGDNGEFVFIRLDFAGDEHHLVYLDLHTVLFPGTGEEDDVDFTVEIFEGGEGHGIAFARDVSA